MKKRFILFLFCDIGSTTLLVIAAIFTSFPTGGAYLNDVLISDVIVYDEPHEIFKYFDNEQQPSETEPQL